MKNFRIIHSVIHALVAGLCWAFFENLSFLKEQVSGYEAIAIPVALAALALLFRQSDMVSKAVIEKIPLVSPVLRRTLSGREYVEGDWALVVVDMHHLEPLYFGFLSITFRDGQHYVLGDDWTPNGAHAVSFHSIQSLYSDSAMHYWYEQGASLHQPEMRGYTEIYFFPHNELAERHAGKFLDVQHTSDIRFYAVKQNYSFLERRLRGKEARFSAAEKVWQDLQPDIETLKTQHISADFE